MTFRPGQSGNPRGRRPGTMTQLKLRKAIQDDLAEIISAMVERAKGGDVAAARLLADKVLPSIKPVDFPAPLPRSTDLTDAIQGPQAILSGLATGALTPEQANAFAAVLANIAKVKEINTFEERLNALERAHAERNPH